MARRDEITSQKIQFEERIIGTPFPTSPTQQKLAEIIQQIEDLPEDIQKPPQKNMAAKRPHNLLSVFVVTDFFALMFGFIAAWQLAIIVNSQLFEIAKLGDLPATYGLQALQFAMFSAGMMLWFARTSHYRTRIPFWMETRKIVEAGAFAMLINGFLQIVSKEAFSRVWFLSAWIFSIVGIVVFRNLARAAMRRMKVWNVPTLVVGSGRSADESQQVFATERNLGYEFVAQIKNLPEAFKAAGGSWVSLCQSCDAQHVVIALDGEDYAHATDMFSQLARQRISFSVVQPTYNLSIAGMTPQFFLGQEVMLMACNDGLDNPLAGIMKRGFDIFVSATALLLVSPVILFLAAIVKTDGGPALYGHKRIGLNGKVFSCLKLRSMVANSSEVLNQYLANNPEARAEWVQDHKLKNDPRVTRLGAVMRRLSLDELPQLLNVLHGDMSIVGPRPIIVAETLKYDSDIAFYYRVRPGITGLWQVSGRNDVTYAERVRMDSWYVRNWSLWNDIAIIFKTVGVVVKGRGAY
jgi:Undecaprenyl-phosphate galactose phosphotransferase WbaP